MPQSQGISAFGCAFKIGDGGSPENFATIAEITDIGGPGSKTTMIDVSNHSSPNAFKEKVAGLIDAGAFKLTMNFTPQAITQNYSTGILRDHYYRNRRNFQMVWPNINNTTLTFAAYVTDFDSKNPVDGKMEATMTVEITGAFTWSN
jgi:hypothetical protein